MKLVMLLWVRDEADIVAQNIRFHFDQGIDHVIVTDNLSKDGTRDILSDLSSTYPMTIYHDPGRDHSQWRWMTRMAFTAREEIGADWILPNDADEFWWGNSITLKTSIRRDALDRGGIDILRCRRLNLFNANNADDSEPWHRRAIYRPVKPESPVDLANPNSDARAFPHFYYALPGKLLLRAKGLQLIQQGNHSVSYATPARSAISSIRIFHFPVRSREQFATKVINGGSSYALNTDLSQDVGWHVRRWYALYQDKGLTAAIDDATPSLKRLQADLATGRLVEDGTLVGPLESAAKS